MSERSLVLGIRSGIHVSMPGIEKNIIFFVTFLPLYDYVLMGIARWFENRHGNCSDTLSPMLPAFPHITHKLSRSLLSHLA